MFPPSNSPSEADRIAILQAEKADLDRQLQACQQRLQQAEAQLHPQDQSLRRSEELLRLTLEFTHIGSWDWQIQSGEVSWNEKHARLLGLVWGETPVNYQAWRDRVHPEDIDRVEAAVNNALATQTNFEAEYRVIHPDGSLRWLSGRGRGIYDDAGQAVHMVGVILDITASKQAEAKLAEQEAHFRAVFEQAAVGLAYANLEGRFERVNRHFCEITGYSEAEILTCTFLDITHPEDLEVDLVQTRQLLAGEISSFSMEKRYLRHDGSPVWINLNVSLLRNSAGEPEWLLGAVRDISDRKQAEAALRQLNLELEQLVQQRTQELSQTVAALRVSEERFRAIFEQSTVGIAGMDLAQQFIFCNQYFCNLVGYSLEELQARTLMDITHPDDQAQDQDYVRALIHQAINTFSLEKRYIHKDGHTVWVAVSGSLQHDVDGKPSFFLAAASDISDRKQVETALRDSEMRYRAIVEDQTELICRFLPNGMLTFVNQAYCRYFGQPAEALLNQPFLPLMLPEDQAWVLEDIASLSIDKPFISHEHQVVLPLGEIRWHQWTNRAIFDDQGEIIEYQAVGQDVTDRRLAAEEVKNSLAEKEVLLKEIHHRVKNNLQMVSSLLSLQANSIQDPKALEPFTDSQRRIKAIALLHEKLYRSKNLAQINFDEYVRGLAGDLFRASTLVSAVALTVEIDKIELAVDTAIPCGLIINELVSNAIKYAFPNHRAGEIRIQFSACAPDRYLLSVEDNGVGLPASVNFHSTTSLGLQLVRALTHKLRGTLELERNGGTRFHITFAYSA